MFIITFWVNFTWEWDLRYYVSKRTRSDQSGWKKKKKDISDESSTIQRTLRSTKKSKLVGRFRPVRLTQAFIINSVHIASQRFTGDLVSGLCLRLHPQYTERGYFSGRNLDFLCKWTMLHEYSDLLICRCRNGLSMCANRETFFFSVPRLSFSSERWYYGSCLGSDLSEGMIRINVASLLRRLSLFFPNGHDMHLKIVNNAVRCGRYI